jgi:hypothetical protein
MRVRFLVALTVIALIDSIPAHSNAVTVDAALSSIACVPHGPQSLCFAVGRDTAFQHGVIVKIVDGLQSAPITVSDALLSGVTCMSSGVCAAVGTKIDFVSPIVVFFNADGVPTQTIDLTGTGAFGPLACPTSNLCLVFGSRPNDPGLRQPTLTVVKRNQSLANTADIASPGFFVQDMSCASAGRCIAAGVGFDIVLSGPQWTASVKTAPFLFDGVDCPLPSQCFAATRIFQNGFPFGAIAPIDADGNAGGAVPMAQIGTTFFGIACVSKHLCVAVGENERTTRGSIVRVVDGVPGTPTDVDGVNFFSVVACDTKSGSCTAIGRSLTGETAMYSFAA